MSLKLQEAFGLRREESIKFPVYADRGDHIEFKGTWTKAGARVVGGLVAHGNLYGHPPAIWRGRQDDANIDLVLRYLRTQAE